MPSQPIRVCVAGVLLVVAVLVILRPRFLFAAQAQISSHIWHWKHHDHAIVGDFDVSVPARWTVREESGALLLSDVVPEKGIATFTIFGERKPVDLDQWANGITQANASLHKPAAEWEEFRVGNDRMLCRKSDEPITVQYSLTGNECRIGNLVVLFGGARSTAPELPEFLKGIKRLK